MRKFGTENNPANRFHKQRSESLSDVEHDIEQSINNVFETDEFTQQSTKSTFHEINVKTVVNKNTSPDVPFSLSLNPYQGCEHGCVYCYARPTHVYLDLSAGKDFESQLFVKMNAVSLLEKEFNKRNYQAKTIALGMNTDIYQPMERKYKITRALLELCLAYKHPISLVTKSSLILRDVDLLAQLAKHNLVHVMVSLTTLDNTLKASLEPQASSPAKRLSIIKTLSELGVPCGVLMAPIIPKINDHEIEAVVEAASALGAVSARYVFLRLPHEVKQLFSDWLEQNYPLRKEAVLSLIKQSRGGKLYDSNWQSRMTGEGLFADLIAKRFKLAIKKYNVEKALPELNVDAFANKVNDNMQATLF